MSRAPEPTTSGAGVPGDSPAHRAGFVALVGRANAGKSTLLNAILGRKLAIVSPKPQTTRHRILGVANRPGAQLLFVDTPGLHRPQNLLGERMVQVARQTLADADVAVWVVDACDRVRDEDRAIARDLAAERRPVVVVLNKIDRLSRAELLERAAALGELLPERHVVPLCALTGDNVGELLATVEGLLPVSPPLYPEDAETDLPERFFAAELVREQLLLATRDEVPYQSAVAIDAFTERAERDLLVIQATILVARDSQKAIVIGRRGERLKEIGRRARLEIEAFFGARVFLELYVKVDERWFTRGARLSELGL